MFRFLQQSPPPEITTIPTALTIAARGPVEVIPPDAVPSDGGVYNWSSQRHPARAIPAGQAVWPRWPIIQTPAERSSATIAAALQSKHSELLRCYQQHGAQVLREADDGGPQRHRWRLAAELEIAPSGAVSNVRVRRLTDTAHPLAECVAESLRSLAFARACMTAKLQFAIDVDNDVSRSPR